MLEGAELTNNNQGIKIESVAQGSPAQASGLLSGDIIVGINRNRITNIAQLRDYLKDKKGVLALNIVRDGHTQYLMIR